jgi:hypothetical protein
MEDFSIAHALGLTTGPLLVGAYRNVAEVGDIP